MSHAKETRMREHPTVRFAAPEHHLSLRGKFDSLLQEPEGARGHRQAVIYKYGPMTVALFAFDHGGHLDEHVVPDGTVSIHLLEGELAVRTPNARYDLAEDDMLLLAPGVPHSVYGTQSSRVIVTVVLEPKDTDGDS